MKKLIAFCLLFLCMSALPVIAGDAPTVSKDELKSMLGSSDLVLLDVRTGRDWSSSEFKIKGAIRASGDDFDKWSETYPKDKKIILYCA